MTFELFYRSIVVTGRNVGEATQNAAIGFPRFEKRFFQMTPAVVVYNPAGDMGTIKSQSPALDIMKL